MENLIPFLVVIGYLLVNFLGKFVEGQKGSQPKAESDGVSVDQMLREMMQQAGFEPEQPVASEHQPTRGEHHQTASEHRATASERRPTSSEHLRSVAETFSTRSEHQRTATEHRLTASEHLKGDAHLPPIHKVEVATTQPPRSKFGQSLVKDLRGGAEPLVKAIVLNEILGPPVALKDRPARS